MTRKLHPTGEPIDVNDRLPLLAERLRADGRVAAAYLYGSYGTPDQTLLSDVDVALLLRQDVAVTAKLRLDLIGLVCSALGEDEVSVTLLNSAPLPL